MKQLKALGSKQKVFTQFDTFNAPDGLQCVTCTSDEITALCPVTGQPDWYTCSVVYAPRKHAVESKSLKLFFQSLRNEGMFCEQLSAMIAKRLGDALKPRWLRVSILQKPRGGIAINAESVYNKK